LVEEIMRKYVECYLNTLVGLEPEAVNKSIASMVKKALVNTTQERAEYFVNGLTFVNKQDPNSATSEGYLLNLLQDLTGLEKETLKGAVERNRDLLKMHTELIIYTGKLVVFGNDMDRMIDTYFEEAAPNLDIPSIILINKTLKEVDNGYISEDDLKSALHHGEMWELIQDRYKALSDNDDDRAKLVSGIINNISEAEKAINDKRFQESMSP
jgi:hypothetical protein|tara:strand:- start:1318 stop:1953 length:636 start_codon:yes stop_codon:yes gene_type:complete